MCQFIVWFSLILLFASTVKATCDKGCDRPINVYDQLKCTPKYENPTDCCPEEYDCSNIFKRPEGMCHLRGKLYKPNEIVTSEVIAENCLENCRCDQNSEFKCFPPSTGCHEYYVPGYPKEECYLRYKLDSCCAKGEVCPPFDNVTKCEVNGNVYKEGQRFPHPDTKCTKCVCTKNFNGKFEAPICQKKNCTTEIRYSKEIDKYCAPYYIGSTCCPAWWICPANGGQYIPPALSVKKSGMECRFGDRIMEIGSKYLYQDTYSAKIECECIVPPFLSCFEVAGE